MKTTTPDSEALSLLRAIFDLAEAELKISEDLLCRLTGHDDVSVRALIGELRAAKLVQAKNFGLSMTGLSIAVGLPEFEPSSKPRSRGNVRHLFAA